MLEPGSEFRSQETLEPLLQDHEHWDTTSNIITSIVSYSLEDLPEHMRKEDLEFMIKRGNHKSATSQENESTFLKNYTKGVERGWIFPVTLE